MTVDRFVEDRRARWARLGNLIREANGRVERLAPDDVLELGRLYRGASSDLAVARRDFALDAATERLNDLVAAGHALVYSEAPTSGRRLRRLLLHELPASVRANSRFTAVSFAAAHGPLGISRIVLSGGAGLRLAWALLRPGDRSRADALRLAGAQAIRVMLLVVPALGVAGILEAFLSPTDAPVPIKISVGLVAAFALWAYIALVGRSFRRSAS